ncbi:MAG: hypothetical protein IKH75_06245 [Ruminococcus sp.]|nr:hypothetical protein [Ruminococcus sp.]
MSKSVKEMLLKKAANMISRTAIKACGATSYFDCYQPKEPANIQQVCQGKKNASVNTIKV